MREFALRPRHEQQPVDEVFKFLDAAKQNTCANARDAHELPVAFAG